MKFSRPTHVSGFSMIELLIVVTVIGVISAIAIPNLVSSRRAANEGSAIASLRTLFGANMTYAATVGNGDYAGDAGGLGTSALAVLANVKLIDPSLGQSAKSGYVFLGSRTALTPTSPPSFYFTANPNNSAGITRTGNRRFGTTEDGVIKYDASESSLGQPFDESTLRSTSTMPVAD